VTGFTFIAGNVTTMSPAIGNGDVFYVQTNHILSEHLLLGASTVIDGNVQSVSGGQIDPDTAFILYTDASLWFFNRASSDGFKRIDSNVASVTGTTSHVPGPPFTPINAAFYVTRDGVLVEWQAFNQFSPNNDGSYVFVDGNIASISTSPGSDDDVFIVYRNGMLFEHTGLSRQAGFTMIDSNVSP
jgi:hypothetical protein